MSRLRGVCGVSEAASSLPAFEGVEGVGEETKDGTDDSAEDGDGRVSKWEEQSDKSPSVSRESSLGISGVSDGVLSLMLVGGEGTVSWVVALCTCSRARL